MARMKKQEVQAQIENELHDEVMELTASDEQGAAPTEKKAYTSPIVKAGYDLETIQKQFQTKSAAIRFLGSKGFKTGDIAKFFPGNGPGGRMRYQHARNVLTQKLKGKSVEETTTNEDTETEE